MNRDRDLAGPALLWMGFAVAVAAGFLMGHAAYAPTTPAAPTCYVGATEDSDPVPVPCDYRLGAWEPRDQVTRHLPPCDSDVPGLPVTGVCWLVDDDGPEGQTRISVWPWPYAPAPLYVLEGSND